MGVRLILQCDSQSDAVAAAVSAAAAAVSAAAVAAAAAAVSAAVASVSVASAAPVGAITKKTGNTMDCDFEPNLCLWQHVPQNTLYWRLRRGRTPSGGTGPGSDHTFGNSTGWLAFVCVCACVFVCVCGCAFCFVARPYCFFFTLYHPCVLELIS